MPHLIIEYAQSLATDKQVAQLMQTVHEAALASGLFPERHIKTRAIPVQFYRTGSGSDPFIHAQLRIKHGRSDAQKKALSCGVLAAIKAQVLAAKVITVEVVDMDSASYVKIDLTQPDF